MKKSSLLLFVFLVLVFSLTGCTLENQNSKHSNRVKKVTGEVKKAKFDEEGNILIQEKDITNKVMYIRYEYENVTIGLLAVRDSKGNVRVVVNTCQSCGGSLYAYFVQVGDKIQCQNCRSKFAIDDLDHLDEDGCNPIGIKEMETKDGVVTIGTEQLRELKDKFENWEGPKA